MNVDLCWLRPWREATVPTQLFHGAQSIRISGRMTRELVTSILGGPRLESLDLNDLKLWAELEPASNFNQKSSASGLASFVSDTVEPELVPPASNHLQELRKYLNVNRARLRMRPNEQVLAGTLDTLAARQIALSSLRITLAGPASGCHPTTQDDSLYRSWARFLASTRNTLCNLFFEQCEGSKTSSGPHRGRERRQTDEPRPMDWLFVQQVLPVLLGAPWPHIKRMEIIGVGRIDRAYQDHLGRHEEVVRVAFPQKAREQLRELLDYEAELVIEERSSAEGEHVDPADPGIPPIYSQWEDWKAIIDRRKQRDHSDSGRNETGGLATCRISPQEQMIFRWPYRSSKDLESALRIVDTRYLLYEEYLGGGPNPEIERA
ncbi:hypothetical protein BKA58DRAFT_464750 [Alternaria rosae]|uniref:uncharacterized protein n=1 Tax=Alternaria rosae TaxID=1187941 RepID=UPI001E8E3CD9|nr:uncharacterized protein BKA58DRAFT_464750 [Alternaria rosae]KAH6882842.1 hypothetical protein BKA58DRAFT_464750 [Alternaria rosae]